ncbi:MAG: LptF/LptG family permease [Bacteroidales bacterium]|nr:LptF/LptG family permease [Bacteroidales bacterium]
MPRKIWRAVANVIERYRIRRIDRYIISKFLSTYIFLIAIIVVIAIIFDYNEKIDKFASSNATWQQVVFDYYLNFVPYFVNLFSPLFVFIAVIFFTSKLADNSEIIAMKSTGMSFKRLLRPYFYSAALIALCTFMLGAYVIPRGNVERVNFENTYIKKKTDITAVDNVQMQVDTGVVAYITHFDNTNKSGYGFSLDKFVNKKLVSHLTAQSIQYDTLSARRFSWTLRYYTIRTLKGMREEITSGERLDTIIIMEPKDFFYVRGQQETMTVPQLSEFIDRQRLRGAAGISTFEVEYHKRFAMPFAAFILTLIGVSLSCEKRKGGMGTSIGIGIALSFSYILFQTISSTFALNAGLPAMIAVWIPNILFAIIAFVLYRRTPQ